MDAIVHAAGLQFSAGVGELLREQGERMWAVHVRGAELVVGGLVGCSSTAVASSSSAVAP